MKTLKVLLAAFVVSMFFAACSDTKDCACEVNTTKKTQTIISDWDGDCSDITAEDVPGWDGNPCSEE